MIQYSGGTYINRIFTPTTRADLINNMTQALADVGMTVISGTPGSSSNVILETAANNVGAKCRFEFNDPGGTALSIWARLRHPLNNALFGSQIYCVPANVWRVIASKRNFFAFMTGGANNQTSRGVLMGGALYTPSFLNIASGDGAGWMQGTGFNDNDPGTRPCFRSQLRGNVQCRFHGTLGPNFFDWPGSTSDPSSPTFAIWQGGLTSKDDGYRWDDTSAALYEGLLAWSFVAGTEAKIKGQTYDTCIISGSWNGEQVLTFDGHTWMIITHAPIINQAATACLVAVIG